MTCPNCAAPAPAGAAECPNCGAIYAKFAKKLESRAGSPPAVLNPWKGRAVAIALLMLWMAALGLYYRQVVARMKVRNPAGPAR